MDQPKSSAEPQLPLSPPEPERVVPAQQLFAGRKEILIEHAGVRYRLRITRRGKLILQK